MNEKANKHEDFNWLIAGVVLGAIVGGLWMALSFFTPLGVSIIGLVVTPLILGAAAFALYTGFEFLRLICDKSNAKSWKENLIDAAWNAKDLALKTLIGATFWTLGSLFVAPAIVGILGGLMGSSLGSAAMGLGIAATSSIIGVCEGVSVFLADLFIVKYLFSYKLGNETICCDGNNNFAWKREFKSSLELGCVVAFAGAVWNVFATPAVNIFNGAGETFSHAFRTVFNTAAIGTIFIGFYAGIKPFFEKKVNMLTEQQQEEQSEQPAGRPAEEQRLKANDNGFIKRNSQTLRKMLGSKNITSLDLAGHATQQPLAPEELKQRRASFS